MRTWFWSTVDYFEAIKDFHFTAPLKEATCTYNFAMFYCPLTVSGRRFAPQGFLAGRCRKPWACAPNLHTLCIVSPYGKGHMGTQRALSLLVD